MEKKCGSQEKEEERDHYVKPNESLENHNKRRPIER